MPIALNPECRKRILEAATNGLGRIVAGHGMFLDSVSCLLALFECEAALPQNGKLHGQLTTYVDDTPFLTFVSGVIATELWERDNYLSDVDKVKLVELEGYNDPAQLAQRLLAQFESLPWRYTWSVKLPDTLSKFFRTFLTEFELSPGLRLICPGSETNKRFPLQSEIPGRNKRIRGNGLLGFFYPEKEPKWNEQSTYLQIEFDGYVGRYGGTFPVAEARRKTKSILGLGLALRLFEIDRSISTGPMADSLHVYVHCLENNNWEIDNKIDLSLEESRGLTSLKFHDLDGHLDTEQKKIGWAWSRLEDIAAVMSAEPESSTILLASQWLFDSYVGTDQLLSFVQAMIVLEILFGDKAISDEMGLSQLLRNRCAYLISDTYADRAQILNDFAEIYKVRSNIVHQGKHRLSAGEFALFNKLRWMCRRSISEEVRLLRATIEQRKSKTS